MKILGIDPGSSLMGFGLIEANHLQQTIVPISYGTLEVKEKDPAKKLLEIFSFMENFLRQNPVDLAAVEKLFFSKNTKTAFEVAQARGVIVLSILKNKIPLLEPTPGEIKVAVASYGSADKKMVAKMVSLMLSLPAEKFDDNTTDALAVAIAASRKNLTNE